MVRRVVAVRSSRDGDPHTLLRTKTRALWAIFYERMQIYGLNIHLSIL